MEYNLEFDDSQYTVGMVNEQGKTLKYRSFENIIYVKNPVDLKFQSLSIFVPEIYYEGKTIGSYDLKSAPILFQNTVGGYMPGPSEKPGKNFMGKTNTAFSALLHGYVVVSPGARGRGLKDAKGEFIGAAPAAICDLKAAVRYLHYNKKKVPGDVEKIISNGTSAGGALSSLLGSTGNHPDYAPYLKEMGTADEKDHIFAASCYCPITDLDHGDMAYEWEFYGLNDYRRMKFERTEGSGKLEMIPVNGVMTKEQIRLSGEVKVLFPGYLNSLKLRDKNGENLELDTEGNGSFKEYIKKAVMASAQKEIDKGADLAELYWITVKNRVVMDMDFERYVEFRTRMKETPAFDNIVLGTPENELFGSKDIQYRHFTKFSKEHSVVNGEMAGFNQIKMMNPMYYIGDVKSDKARHFRIRHGSMDRDTSLAIPAMLTLMLKNHDINAELEFPWGIPHAGDYDLDDLFTWIDKICG